MHAITERRGRRRPDQPELPHHWVGASLVSLGRGPTLRAEHAARTGRHVLGETTRVEVLEVYCRSCRVGYDSAAARVPCTGLLLRAG